MSCNDIDHMLYLLADYPLLERLAKKRTRATRLDGRACRFLYAEALNDIDITKFSESEGQLFYALKRNA